MNKDAILRCKDHDVVDFVIRYRISITADMPHDSSYRVRIGNGQYQLRVMYNAGTEAYTILDDGEQDVFVTPHESEMVFWLATNGYIE